jgi:YCII-related domain
MPALVGQLGSLLCADLRTHLPSPGELPSRLCGHHDRLEHLVCAAATELGGYLLINAADLEAATSLAQGCPFLQAGGGVEVGELTLLNPDSIATTIEDHARATQARS